MRSTSGSRSHIRVFGSLALLSSLGLALLGTMAPTAQAAGTTWYVNHTGGSDSNDCLSATTACLTINGALGKKAFASVDTVSIAAGTYNEAVIVPAALTSVTLTNSVGTSQAVTGGRARPLASQSQLAAASAGTAILDGTGKNASVVTSSANTTLTISGLVIQNGASPSDGGGINASGPLIVANSLFSNNSAVAQSAPDQGGGGIYADATLTVSNSIFVNNSATTQNIIEQGGGAIYADGAATVSNSTFSANQTIGFLGGGGGIYAVSALTVLGSTFNGNSAQLGGGIYAENTLAISNSTIANNATVVSQGNAINNPRAAALPAAQLPTSAGAGIYHLGTNTAVILANDTISGNATAPNGVGGGISQGEIGGGTPIIVKNTIIAGNTASGGPDCFTNLASGGNNILGNNSSCLGLTNGANGDQVGASAAPIDPKLGPLQDNGGPTQTMALLPGSPAINAGNPNGCTDAAGNALTTDQRGLPRPDTWSGKCDIGAFELQACTILATVLGPTTTGLTARLGVANIPNLKNVLMYITFRVGASNFVARFSDGTFGCVGQDGPNKASATALLNGSVDSGRGFSHGDGIMVFIQLQNTAGVPQVDVTDTTTNTTYTIKGPLSSGSAIVIK